jgi:predicted transcriptional regulator
MIQDYEKTASEFLELASEQRLGIILRLVEKESNVSKMAKELDATVPEVYRNFDRLVKAGLIYKDTDGNYHLTTYGKTVCTYVPSLLFMSRNKKYFIDHNFGDVPRKFIDRIGALAPGQRISGIVKVLEQWKDIYENSTEYIYNVLSEVPYTVDLMEPLVERIKKGVKVNSIFSESAIVPKERKKILDKLEFKKFIDKGVVERKMRKNVSVVVVLNEKEAGIMFPTTDGNADMREMLYSNDQYFHEWCLDFFRYCWYDSTAFQESKFKEQ